LADRDRDHKPAVSSLFDFVSAFRPHALAVFRSRL